MIDIENLAKDLYWRWAGLYSQHTVRKWIALDEDERKDWLELSRYVACLILEMKIKTANEFVGIDPYFEATTIYRKIQNLANVKINEAKLELIKLKEVRDGE